ncbi:hypothetical protein BJF78_14000 [Pseudonocardia sp. CNS-139]|nr:hypothetical protein BJF78_14000 [Pseudonocardia sp. CNS-139]
MMTERVGDVGNLFRDISAFASTGAAGSLDLARGDAAAIVHVAGSALTSAEPATAPGIVQRLIGGGHLSRAAWRDLQRDSGGSGLAERVLERGLVDSAVLGALTRSVLVDALLELAAGSGELVATPLDGDQDWWASPLRHDVDEVLREVSVRLVNRAEIPVGAVVALGTPAVRTVVLTRLQWKVAQHTGPGSTVGEIARESGLALYETSLGLVDLVDSGLCLLDQQAAWPLLELSGRPPEPDRDSDVELEQLPRRVPGATSLPDAQLPSVGSPPTRDPQGARTRWPTNPFSNTCSTRCEPSRGGVPVHQDDGISRGRCAHTGTSHAGHPRDRGGRGGEPRRSPDRWCSPACLPPRTQPCR